MDTLGERAAAWVRRIRSLFSRRFDDELADEMRMHLDLRRQALIDDGMDPREAKCEARRLFGNPTVLRERSRDAWGFATVASFWRDLEFGARLLLRHPAQSGAIVLTIALGAGLNARFLAVNAVFFRSPDISNAHEVVRLDDGKPNAGLSYPDYVDYRDRAAAAVDLAAFGQVDVTVRLEGTDAPVVERAGIASGNFFDVLGVRPIHGRTFTGRDDLPPLGTAVVVLSEAYWARRFNRDPGVVGRSIELNRRPFTVIGVVPASFRGVDPPGGPPFVRGVWLPLWTLPLLDPGNRHLVGRTMGWGMQAVGRLHPGVSLDRTKAQIGAAGAMLDREFPGARHARTPWISPITDIDTRLFVGPVGLALAGAVPRHAARPAHRLGQRRRPVARAGERAQPRDCDPPVAWRWTAAYRAAVPDRGPPPVAGGHHARHARSLLGPASDRAIGLTAASCDFVRARRPRARLSLALAAMVAIATGLVPAL